MTAVFDIPPVYCSIPSAVHPDAGLIERGAVAEPQMSGPVVRALTEITWLLLGWDNDLHSHFKETREAESAYNLVEVLAREHRLGAGAAAAGAVAL